MSFKFFEECSGQDLDFLMLHTFKDSASVRADEQTDSEQCQVGPCIILLFMFAASDTGSRQLPVSAGAHCQPHRFRGHGA